MWGICCQPVVKHNVINPKFSVILSPSSALEGKKGQPSKTGDMDEGITPDHPYLQWMKAVYQHIKASKKAKDPFISFIPLNMKQLSDLFAKAVDGCGFRGLGVQCSDQIRHGSASTDMLNRQRTVEELMKRGRWKTMSSLGQYEQGGCLSQIFGKLSKTEQKRALQAELDLPPVLATSLGCKKLQKQPLPRAVLGQSWHE